MNRFQKQFSRLILIFVLAIISGAIISGGWIYYKYIQPKQSQTFSTRSTTYTYAELVKKNTAIKTALQDALLHIYHQPSKKTSQETAHTTANNTPNKAKITFDEIRFKELKGGMTSNRLYRFDVDGKNYVLRTLSGKQSLEHRKNEITAHKIAADLGIAPNLIFVDSNYTLMIIPFIEGHTLNHQDLRDETILQSIGTMLAKLHHYKDDFPLTRTQVVRTRKHYEKALEKGIAFPTVYSHLYEEFIVEGEKLQKQHQALTHADLNPANIILTNDGRIYIIDWTSATRDNFYTDLGYFSFVNGLTEAQSKIFLSAYFGHMPTANEWEQFKLAQKRTSFLTSAVWFDFSESDADKLIPMEERVKKLDALLYSDSLKKGQQYVADEQVISPSSGNAEAIRLYALGFLKTYITWDPKH